MDLLDEINDLSDRFLKLIDLYVDIHRNSQEENLQEPISELKESLQIISFKLLALRQEFEKNLI